VGHVEEHEHAAPAVECAGRVGALLTATDPSRRERSLFDIEPYMLPAWKRDYTPVLSAFKQLTFVLREASERARLELWLTLPFWFLSHIHQHASYACLQNVDGLVIMDICGLQLNCAQGRAVLTRR
jgi:hypothetical protein